MEQLMQQMQITKPPFAKPVYVAIYLRLSRDDEQQGESGSIQTQRQLLTKYCQDNGFYIVGEYVDDGYSGTNFDRPGFQRMIDDIEDGRINCVITKDLSRLGRNYILTGQYTDFYFPSKGVRYIAVNDGIDSDKGNAREADVEKGKGGGSYQICRRSSFLRIRAYRISQRPGYRRSSDTGSRNKIYR